MEEDNDEDTVKRRKKDELTEHYELNKILATLDYQDKRDLAAHLLVACHYRRSQRPSKRRKQGPRNDASLIITDLWTAWPLPSKEVPRQDSAPPSSSDPEGNLSTTLEAEIEAAILRVARTRIQSQNPSSVSLNEHPPYQVTRQLTSHVIARLDRLLHALGRINYTTITERGLHRTLRSRWDELVGIAAVSQCVAHPATMQRITERCNQLFEENMEWETGKM
jgi:RNA polymerase I specific transcription initiation factor